MEETSSWSFSTRSSYVAFSITCDALNMFSHIHSLTVVLLIETGCVSNH